MFQCCESKLLIEPVWNRNMPVLNRRLDLSYQLLIEPVWNRNRLYFIRIGIQPTFNRTSMESKH